MVFTSGTKLGPYELIALLGAGGMGEVYRARDTRLERTVAIKVLTAQVSADSDLKARLEREAKSISSLTHPQICALYDVGEQDGVQFLVMEYLEGETLADRLQRARMPLEETLKVGMDIAKALSAAHRQGIVHRDLKPANIMLTKHGAKLMDFGLAKPATSLGAAAGHSLTPSTPTINLTSLSASASPLTQKGTVVGTFQYIAPEVLQGMEADVRSDIFSFGCVLYEMLTGRRAFEGKSQFTVLGAILDKEPEPVTAIRPDLPHRLHEIVRHCLAKNPDQRYGCMHDVEIQLKTIAEEPSEKIASPRTAAHRFRGWATAAVLGLVVLAVTFAYLNVAKSRAPVVRASILPPPGTSFVMMEISSGPPVLSPDGTKLSFTARDDKGKVMLYVRPLNSMTAQVLAGTENAMYPFWSADSSQIGFFADNKLKRINSNGGPPQTVCDANNGRGGAWSKGDIIVFTPGANHPLFRVSAEGGPVGPASRLDLPQGQSSHRWPQFLPDGKHFLFWMRSSQGAQHHALYIGELGSLQPKLLMKTDSVATYAAGYLLFLRDQTLMAQPFDLRRLELTGEAVPLAEHVGINGATNRPMFSASESGGLVYQTGQTAGTWNLQWFTRDGKQLSLIGPPDRYVLPALSPDGRQLAVSTYTVQGTGDIWILDLARGTKMRLTFGPAVQIGPIWTPDGRTIFYNSNFKGAYHIYAKAADGSGSERTVLESKDAEEFPVSFSPDGRYLVYFRRSAGDNSKEEIWGLPLFGSGKPFPIVQSSFKNVEPSISPDGKWMAYQNNESGRMEVYITAFPRGGAKWQVSSDGGVEPKWRRDGRELFFLQDDDSLMAVDVNTSGTAVHLGVPHSLFRASGAHTQQGPYDVTADGKKFLINAATATQGKDPVTLVLNWPAELKR